MLAVVSFWQNIVLHVNRQELLIKNKMVEAVFVDVFIVAQSFKREINSIVRTENIIRQGPPGEGPVRVKGSSN